MINVYDGNNCFRRVLERDPRPYATLYSMANSIQGSQIWVWDGPMGNQRRRDLLPRYKAQREGTSESIKETMELVKELISYSSSNQVQLNDYEADDVVAHVARYFADQGAEVVVHTSDYDMVQLCQHDRITSTVKPKPEIPPDKVRLYKAWVGDPSDNIPGAAGFGAKAWETYRDDPALMELIGNAMRGEWKPERASEVFVGRSKKVATFLNSGGWQQLATCWKIVGFLTIPHAEVESRIVPGKNDPAAAQELMDRWLQPPL